MQTLDYDYCVVGSGLAGLLSALHLGKSGSVLVVTKKGGADSNTNYAQGGIASVMAVQDTFESHVADTLEAGAGLCDETVVRDIVAAGPQAVAELEALGISFAQRKQDEGGGYDLGKEGGHSERRVLHAGDITGREIEAVLLERIREAPNVTLREQAMAIELITTDWLEHRGVDTGEAGRDGSRCVGIYLLDRTTGEICAVRAPRVILTSGGGGKVYLYTSNPDVATGDGLAMAWRAGLPIKNMEFIQFHPTCLYHPEAKSFLVSEAVRGEGAKLVDGNEQEFMQRYDERGALAPRDVVARAIDEEMKLTGAPCVYLDIRHQPREFLQERFPNIFATCLGFGIDMSKDLVPVVPAAHYFCGGVEAKVNGETAMPGLYAAGEVACTGLHGANRLASNSLLEAVVCARRMADHLVDTPPPEFDMPPIADWEYGDAVTSDEAIVVEHNWNEVRTCMWDYVGIVRTDKRLERAARRIGNLHHEIYQYYMDYLVNADILELRNIAAVAELIIRSAQLRRESRGLHSTLDCPEFGSGGVDTLITDPPGGDTRLGV